MTELHPFGPSSHAPLEDPAEMPECYPIKGNVDSMLYHRSDSMNWGATIAEVWFVSPSAAEAAGFTLSNTHPKNSSSADFEPGGSEHPCSAAQVSGVVGAAGGAGSAAGSPSVDAAADAAESAAASASGAAGAASDTGSSGLGKAAAIGGAGVAGLAAAATGGLGGAKDAAASAVGGAKDAVSGVADLGGAKDAAASAVGGATDGAAGAADTAKDAVSGVADLGGAKDAAASAVGGAKDGAAGAADTAKDAVSGVADLGGAKDAASSAAGGAKDAVSGVADLGGAKDAAAGAAAGATGAAAGAVGGAKDAAAGAVGGAKDAAAGAVGGAKDAAAGAVGGAKDAAAGAASGVTGAAAGAASGVTGAAVGATGAVAGVAGMAAASGDTADASAGDSAEVSAAATNDADHPFGPGSHVPLSDVHEMPDCHPIKGNADSMKYHRPDSSGYAETKAEVWFVSPSAAEASGFVLAGSHPQGSSSADFEPGTAGHPCTADQLRGMGLGGLLIGGAAAGAVAATLMSSGSGDAEVASVVEDVEVEAPETERVVYRAADTPTDDIDVEGKSGISGKTAAAAAGGAALVGGLAAAAKAKGDDIDVAKPKIEKPKVSKPKVEKPKVAKPKVEKASSGKVTTSSKATTAKTSSSVKETANMGKAAAGGRGGVGKVPTAKGGFGWGWLKWLLPLLLLAALILLLLWACGGDDDPTPVTQPAVVPTATAIPPTATAVPPTATAVPEPTATPVPDPTATPVPEPTATPEPAPAAYVACADLLGTLNDNGFAILATAANLAGFEDQLAGEDPLTIFAPTDAAFEAVPEETLNTALGDPALLASIISYHVVPGAVTSADLSDAGVATANGANLAVRLDLGAPRVNNAGVTDVDIASGDCVVHGVDSILTPPVLLSSLGFTSLNDAVSGGNIIFEPGTADLTAADSATLAAICNLVANESSARSLPPINWESTGNAEIDQARAAAIEAALADCGPPVFNYNEVAGNQAADSSAAPEFTG